MKVFLTGIFLFLFCCSNLSAQKERYVAYNALINKAMLANIDRDYETSVEYYKKAFEIIDWTAFHYFEASMVALQAKDTAQAEKFLLKGISKGLNINSFSNGSFVGKLNAARGGNIEARFDILRAQYLRTINKPYLDQLQLLRIADQKARHLKPLEMQKADSANFDDLLALTKNFGFPTYKKVGADGYNIAWLLLWHHREEYPNTSEWQQIIPLIRTEIENGTIEPSFLCMFEDYKYYLNGQMQQYGCLLAFLRDKTDEIKMVPKNKLNRNRANIGIEPIEDFAKKIDFDLDKINRGEWLRQGEAE